MEELLNRIIDRLDSMDRRFDSMDRRFDSMDQRFDSMDKRFDVIDQRFDSHDKKFVSIEERLGNLENGQFILQSEQSEMRKEVAFYYGSLMKKLDETKIELSSEIRHVSNVQKQHQDVLEILNEKHQ